MISILVTNKKHSRGLSSEAKWSFDDLRRAAISAGADVFRYGKGLRIEFDEESDAEEFIEKIHRGGFSYVEA